MEYTITFEKTMQATITVKAKNEIEAEEKARECLDHVVWEDSNYDDEPRCIFLD